MEFTHRSQRSIAKLAKFAKIKRIVIVFAASRSFVLFAISSCQ